MSNRNFLIIVVVIALVGLGSYIFLAKRAKEFSAVPRDENEPVSGSQSTFTNEVHEVTIEADEYTYSPSLVTLKNGERVRLTFRNKGSSPHGLVIPGLNVETKEISKGLSDTVEFTVTKTGTFEFHCPVGNHASLGMKGSIQIK